MLEGLIGVILVIAIIGVIVWFVTTYVPMPPAFKTGILIIAAIVVVLYLLRAFGIGVALP